MPRRTPILKSCCCWRSLRKGSYAAGIYTMFYFTTTFTMMCHFMYEERRYLMGNQSAPESSSFLEPETITETTMIFNFTLLLCSMFGVLATILLFAGIHTVKGSYYQANEYHNVSKMDSTAHTDYFGINTLHQFDRRCLLLPWIVVLGLDTLLEVSHCIYMFILETLNFNPITAILFTLDFMMIALHIYAWLCVISQYQEYCLGRGTAAHDRCRRIQQRNMLVRSSSVGGRCGVGQPSQSSRMPLQDSSTVYSSYITSAGSKHSGSVILAQQPQTQPPSAGSAKKRVQFPDTRTAGVLHEDYIIKYVKDAPGVEIQNLAGTPCSPLKEEDQCSDAEDEDEDAQI